jgi:hypothetical protein
MTTKSQLRIAESVMDGTMQIAIKNVHTVTHDNYVFMYGKILIIK